MFDGLWKSKFYSKCKSAIKLTKTRIEIIKRKRSAIQKYLKNDVVELLKNGLDTNAYGRVEGLWNEQNFSSCYDFVEQCCSHISSHLACMDKQRECPEECKEAASSLMFAAARFADLPELRDLRTIFTERYGNSIEFYVNKEFVNKLKSTHPPRDVKLQLMQGIALEAGLQWDSKTLEQTLHKNPHASAPDSMKSENDEKSMSPKWIDNADQKIDDKGAECKIKDQLKYTCSEPEVSTPIKDIQVDRIERKVQQKETYAVSTSEEEKDDKEPFYYKSIRPPYTKARISITKTTPDAPTTGTGAKVREKMQKTDQIDDSDGLGPDESIGDTTPKPKSVRRRIQKTWPGQDKVENSKSVGSENASSKGLSQRGEEEGRKHLISNERKHDEEEKTMDRLLLHYSRKKLPPDTGGSEGDLQPSQKSNNTGRGTKERGRDGLPSRTASLPVESSPAEDTRLPARASSFQPEVLNSNGHVHPKMPEYDDFVARLAVLRGTL